VLTEVVVMRWQVQDAKQRFSEVLRAAESGEPQIVTKHGEEVAVLIDIAEYRRLRGETVGFMQYLQSGPVLDDELDVTRSDELPREIDLAG
jgi:prevent-host-death family protein